MSHLLEITRKDLLQNLRRFDTYLFMLIMPIAFTLLFAMAFGGFGGGQGDRRLPVGLLDLDRSPLSHRLQQLLAASEVIRLDSGPPIGGWSEGASGLEAQVREEKLAAALIIPVGYGHDLLEGRPARLIFIGEPGSSGAQSVQAAAVSALSRLNSAVRLATTLERLTAAGPRPLAFDDLLVRALQAWETPPIRVVERLSSAISLENKRLGVINSAVGSMLQFAIAGLLTISRLLVEERKTRALPRLFTTAARRVHILLGHYLALLLIILAQFGVLILFGQLALQVQYSHAPAATALVAFSYAAAAAGLGLLIGVLARNEEQTIIISILAMFLLAGLGGAWVPLEATSPTFQAIGHLSPIAWAMDGLKNVVLRGQGLESAWLPAGVLLGYALLFLILAAWRFSRLQES